MVGLFINTLPVRVAVPDEGALVALAATSCRRSRSELRQYEHSPLVEVQGWSEVPRGTPLFESLVVFENYRTTPALGARAGGLGVRSTRVLEQTNYPLTLVVAPGAELLLQVGYDARRFDAGRDRAAARPPPDAARGDRRRARAAPRRPAVAAEAERRGGVLVEWNATRGRLSPTSRCVHQLVRGAGGADARRGGGRPSRAGG